jgi:hypothetical protein
MKTKFKEWIQEENISEAKINKGPYFRELMMIHYKADNIQAKAIQAAMSHSKVYNKYAGTDMAISDDDLKKAQQMAKKALKELDKAQQTMFDSIDIVSGVVKD